MELINPAWQYKYIASRDLRFDWLRGYAVLIMLVDHIGSPSWLYIFTGGDRFYVSAAEAFVFISGFIVGVVYGGVFQRETFQAVWQKAWKRAWTLYKLTLVLYLFILIWSSFFPSPWQAQLPESISVPLISSVLLLEQTFDFVDIPLVYTVLMLLAPFALYLLHAQKGWLLLLISGSLWLVYQIPGFAQLLPLLPNSDSLNVQTWQLLFFTAMFLGYHRESVSRFFSGLPKPITSAYLKIVNLLTVILLAIFIVRFLEPSQTISASISENRGLVDVLFDKKMLAVGRLIAAFFIFQYAFWAVTYYWKPLQRVTSWFIPFGQNSLYAYTVHLAWIAVYGVLTVYLPSSPFSSSGVSFLAQILAIICTYWMIQKKVLFQIIPR